MGGIESCVLNLSRCLVARGHQVEVVTLDRDLRSDRQLSTPSHVGAVAVHRIPFIGSRRYPIAPTWFRFVGDFDVIHVHAIDFFIDSAAAAKFLRFHNKPIVLTSHGGIFHTQAWRRLKRFYWNRVLYRSLRAVDAVVAVSEKDAALFRSIVPDDKLITIPNGIDPAFAAARPSRKRGRLVSVGRVSPAKRIEEVIRLVARVKEEIPEIELVIVGPEEDGVSDGLRRESERLGVASKVRILGERPLTELAELVASAHLFVSAAPHEGFGITTVEALRAGIPVFVTPTGVHTEIVKDGVNGWFWNGVADDDAARVLRHALLLPDRDLERMSEAASTSAEPFNWEHTTAKYEYVFENVYRQNLR